MKGRLIGIIILVVIAAAALVYQFVLRDGDRGGGLLNRQMTRVTGFIGSEKSNLLDNEELKDLLRSRFGLEVDYRKAGSIEMIDMDASGMDFLWPSSQVALELYKLRHGSAGRSETVFNSPIVFYSWADVADALVAAGYAGRATEGYYQAPVEPLIRMVLEGRSWASLGMDSLYGSVVLISTDPSRSNSGNLFSGLVANILYGGVVDEAALPSVLPDVLRVFALQGYMEHSTGTLYERYLELGMGSFPVIVGYENQIVEFSLQHPDFWPQVKDEMVIIYPVPTVFSEHPLIALTEGGERLIDALLDEEVQKIAWEQHGFRTGIENDPSALGISGIPTRVTQIIRMPVPAVMDTIARELQ